MTRLLFGYLSSLLYFDWDAPSLAAAIHTFYGLFYSMDRMDPVE